MHRIPALLGAVLARLGDEPRAMVRTTIAVTTMQAGHALNAMPGRATATLNARILPGQSVDDVIAHVRRVIADDRVAIELLAPTQPSGISPASGPAWDRVCAAITATFPEAGIAPYLQLGATDSRQFTPAHGCGLPLHPVRGLDRRARRDARHERADARRELPARARLLRDAHPHAVTRN